MDLIRPHVFALVAAARRPLQIPITMVSVTVPRGSVFRLDYIMVAYNRTVAMGAQTSPELLFTLLDTRGVVSNNPDLIFRDVTTPAGGPTVKAAWGWRVEYPPGAIITMEVRGMDPGPVPAYVSITYIGQKGWGQR